MSIAAVQYDVIILGAGGAGLMCALHAGRRGRRVLVLDHNKSPGEKIRISGGGRCNFTNLNTAPERFQSANPHFAISALSRYKPSDFISMLEAHRITFHEKTKGQLFCDGSATQVIKMLVDECQMARVELLLATTIEDVQRHEKGFSVVTTNGVFDAPRLVVATGGKSIPKMGATGLGYRLAEQFRLGVVFPRPGLVPMTFSDDLRSEWAPMSGISLEASVACNGVHFDDALLITHRGLSGPAILQISSHWREGDHLTVDFLPKLSITELVIAGRHEMGKKNVANFLSIYLPKRLARYLCDKAIGAELVGNLRVSELSASQLERLAMTIHQWKVKPQGSEGFRTAEVTLGGVDTDALSSKTMETKTVPGLFFIGEVVDVTGELGGFNFQWAWSSGYVAAQHV